MRHSGFDLWLENAIKGMSTQMVLIKAPCEGGKTSKRSLFGGKYEIFKAAFKSCRWCLFTEGNMSLFNLLFYQ